MKYFNLANSDRNILSIVLKSDFRKCSKEIQREKKSKNIRISVDWMFWLLTHRLYKQVE